MNLIKLMCFKFPFLLHSGSFDERHGLIVIIINDRHYSSQFEGAKPHVKVPADGVTMRTYSWFSGGFSVGYKEPASSLNLCYRGTDIKEKLASCAVNLGMQISACQ